MIHSGRHPSTMASFMLHGTRRSLDCQSCASHIRAMTGIPPEDPVEDPTAPDMAVVPLSRHFAKKAREVSIDVPDSLNPYGEVQGKASRGMPRRMLTATELRMCEIYARSTGKRVERAHFVETELKRKYGMEAPASAVLAAVMSRAGKKYRKALWMRGRKIALRALKNNTMDVVDDYLWSRTAAKDQGDYKEVRLAAVDHLDRLGVTLKKEVQQQQAQVIVIKGGGNFDVSNLDTPTPEVLATEIIEEETGGAA